MKAYETLAAVEAAEDTPTGRGWEVSSADAMARSTEGDTLVLVRDVGGDVVLIFHDGEAWRIGVSGYDTTEVARWTP